MVDVYQDHGFSSRGEYLQHLADHYSVPLQIVSEIANVLGPSEDFDGLVIEVEDYSSTVYDFVPFDDFDEEL